MISLVKIAVQRVFGIGESLGLPDISVEDYLGPIGRVINTIEDYFEGGQLDSFGKKYFLSSIHDDELRSSGKLSFTLKSKGGDIPWESNRTDDFISDLEAELINIFDEDISIEVESSDPDGGTVTFYFDFPEDAIMFGLY